MTMIKNLKDLPDNSDTVYSIQRFPAKNQLFLDSSLLYDRPLCINLGLKILVSALSLEYPSSSSISANFSDIHLFSKSFRSEALCLTANSYNLAFSNNLARTC